MWANPQLPADLVAFTEEIRNGKLIFVQWMINNWHGYKFISCKSVVTKSNVRISDHVAFKLTCMAKETQISLRSLKKVADFN